MADSNVNVTEGSGKKLRTWNRTVGGQSVEDEYILLSEPALLSYVTTGGGTTATANSHILQVMAGASLRLRIRRIRIYQTAAATAVTLGIWGIYRLTTAGTGGGAVTPSALESGDAASGATSMTLPTAKGTEGVLLGEIAFQMGAAGNVTGYGELIQLPNQKARTVNAGTTQGIAIKNLVAIAGGAIDVMIEFDESSF
jgi:hypothetical protein